MGLKGMVMELLRAGDSDALEAMVFEQPRAVRHLLGRLWDTDQGVRQTAACAIGAAAAADHEMGADLARRLMWGLNDESATNGVYGIVALGEMGARAPELMVPFVAPMASYLWDDGLRMEILKALVRMSESKQDLVDSARAVVKEFAGTSDPEERRLIESLLGEHAEEAGGSHDD